MLSIKFVAVLLGLVAAVTSQNYDYDSDEPAARSAPARIQSSFSGSNGPKPTPVPILKQINRHNEDGSYTYGYESADGSFKIETKLPTGEVKGKYGYVDDTGKVRVIEYGATKYGFEPSGEGITVAPPTLVDETTNKDGTLNPAYTDQYYEPEQPQQQPISRPQLAPISRPQPARPSALDSYTQDFGPSPQRSPAPAPPRFTSIANAIPSPSRSDFERPRSFVPAPQKPAPTSFSFSPAPVDEEENYAEPAQPRPLPKITYAQPAPAPRPVAPSLSAFASAPAPRSQYAPRPQPVARQSGGGGGVLDQLARDYALPQGGAAPLHDISFGYY